MTTEQVLKAIRQSAAGILGDGSRYDDRNANFAKGMAAMAYFQGDITSDDYRALNAEIDERVKGEPK